MAELNEGSIALPKRQVPLDATALAPPTHMLPILNWNAQPLHVPIGRAPVGPPAHLAIGYERRVAGAVESPRYHPGFLLNSTSRPEPRSHLATGMLADNAPQPDARNIPLHLTPYAAPSTSFNGALPAASFPSVDDSRYTVHEIAEFPPYLYSQSYRYTPGARTSAVPAHDVASLPFAHQVGLTKTWQPSPPLSSTDSNFTRPAISASPSPLPVPVRRHNPRRPKYYGPFEACSREDVLPEFAGDSDWRYQKEEDGGIDGNAWIGYLQTLAETEKAQGNAELKEGMRESSSSGAGCV